jgi:hypothetical protein
MQKCCALSARINTTRTWDQSILSGKARVFHAKFSEVSCEFWSRSTQALLEPGWQAARGPAGKIRQPGNWYPYARVVRGCVHFTALRRIVLPALHDDDAVLAAGRRRSLTPLAWAMVGRVRLCTYGTTECGNSWEKWWLAMCAVRIRLELNQNFYLFWLNFIKKIKSKFYLFLTWFYKKPNKITK